MPIEYPKAVDPALLRGLAATVRLVALPGDEAYAALAAPWNLAVPSLPLAVVEPADAAEIAHVVRFANAHRIPVAVQCTGHGAADNLDGALLVVTRRLTECTVHPGEGWARVGAGVAWQQVLDAASPHGLAPLAGSSPGVGVVGYTTGGGLGPLARTHGAASDRVRAFEVVTGDGELRRVTPTEHPDLFWGLRGGKGALGIVTAVEFDLLPIRELYAGAVYFDGAAATAVIGTWAGWCETVPREATTSIAMLQLPPMPGVPEPLAGRFTVAVRFAWTGDPAAGAAVLAPIRAVAPPLIDAVGVMPYVALGAIHADPVDPLPVREVSGLLASLPAEAIDRLLAVAGPESGSPQLLVELRQLGGAVAAGGARHGNAVPGAFAGSDAAFSLFVVGVEAPPIAEAVRAHGDALSVAMAPWLTGFVLPNFAPGGDAARFRRVFPAETLARLRAISTTYDPAGVLLAASGLLA